MISLVDIDNASVKDLVNYANLILYEAKVRQAYTLSEFRRRARKQRNHIRHEQGGTLVNLSVLRSK